MIRVDLPKLDLNEIPAEQHSAALQRQLAVLIEQINISLQGISASDIALADGRTLEDLLKTSE